MMEAPAAAVVLAVAAHLAVVLVILHRQVHLKEVMAVLAPLLPRDMVLVEVAVHLP
jgi:hypothetical protein